jgi:pimeloyl-ACP methyl ester carboxylesterase
MVLPGERITVAGRPGFIFWPSESKRRSPQPWVMYAPTLAGYPDSHEQWMHEQFLEAGVAVAGVDVGEAYGSPKSREGLTALYGELIGKRGFAKRPVLLGRSRGGLWVTSWASENPEKVAGIAGIYPVLDLRTYPGLEKAAPAYGLSEAKLKEGLGSLNPINRVEVLARNKVPVFIIHGDDDKVVPLKENSATLMERYREAGSESAVTLVVAKGQGHNYWEGFFRCQALIDFVIARAKGAE